MSNRRRRDPLRTGKREDPGARGFAWVEPLDVEVALASALFYSLRERAKSQGEDPSNAFILGAVGRCYQLGDQVPDHMMVHWMRKAGAVLMAAADRLEREGRTDVN